MSELKYLKYLDAKKRAGHHNRALCEKCTGCCEYVSANIDKPTCQTDFDNMLWMVLHDDVHIWVDDENEWYVHFNARCGMLTEDGLCIAYDQRPNMCKEYDQFSCPKYTGETGEKLRFSTDKELIEFFKNHKNKRIREQFLKYLKKVNRD